MLMAAMQASPYGIDALFKKIVEAAFRACLTRDEKPTFIMFVYVRAE